MLLRRAIPLALAIAAIACEPPVPFDASAHNPSFVDYAVFDPAPDPVDNSPVDIPLPSDVALQPQALATQSGAQLEVLQSFAAQGGWPADQDLALTNTTHLLDDWFLDSLGIVVTVLFLESNFKIKFSRADINGAAFASIDSLTDIVAR